MRHELVRSLCSAKYVGIGAIYLIDIFPETAAPTSSPTVPPTSVPTVVPTVSPSRLPTASPSARPTLISGAGTEFH